MKFIAMNHSLEHLFLLVESPQSTHAALSSSPEDDFVLVPSNIPLDHSIESIGERQQ